MDVSAREVEQIARVQLKFEDRGAGHVAGRRKRLRVVRQRQRRLENAPLLAPCDLQDENVVRVVVRSEA